MKTLLAIDLLKKTLLELEAKGHIVAGLSLEQLNPKKFYELEDTFKIYLNYKEQKSTILYKETLEVIIRLLSEVLKIDEEKIISTINEVVKIKPKIESFADLTVAMEYCYINKITPEEVIGFWIGKEEKTVYADEIIMRFDTFELLQDWMQEQDEKDAPLPTRIFVMWREQK